MVPDPYVLDGRSIPYCGFNNPSYAFRNISLIIFIYMFAVLIVFAFTKRQVNIKIFSLH